MLDEAIRRMHTELCPQVWPVLRQSLQVEVRGILNMAWHWLVGGLTKAGDENMNAATHGAECPKEEVIREVLLDLRWKAGNASFHE